MSRRGSRPTAGADDGLGPFVDILFILVFALVLFVRHETEQLAIAQGQGGADGVTEYDPVNGVNVDLTEDGLTVDGTVVTDDQLIELVTGRLQSEGKTFVNFRVVDKCLMGQAIPLREKLVTAIGRTNVFEILDRSQEN